MHVNAHSPLRAGRTAEEMRTRSELPRAEFLQDVQEEAPEQSSKRHGGMRSGVDKNLSPFLRGRNNS